MRIWIYMFVAMFWLLPGAGKTGERDFRLSAPGALAETGLLKYLLPRFSLKTSIRIEVVGSGEAAEVALTAKTGRAVFSGMGTTWHMSVEDGHAGAARFAKWLTSEVGRRTVTSYAVEGSPAFTLPEAGEAATESASYAGNALKGRDIATRHCGRCHVVSEASRMNAIGSTPSFFLLRSLSNWDQRFEAFFTLNPHPAFTQVAGVTAPFAINLPPPIYPVEITLDDLDAILAYVSQLTPADLGAPINHQ